MNFWQFVFFFLFVRNWHTGQLELSRPRVALFMAGMFLIMFGFLLVSVMRTPVMYSKPISTKVESKPLPGTVVKTH